MQSFTNERKQMLGSHIILVFCFLLLLPGVKDLWIVPMNPIRVFFVCVLFGYKSFFFCLFTSSWMIIWLHLPQNVRKTPTLFMVRKRSRHIVCIPSTVIVQRVLCVGTIDLQLTDWYLQDFENKAHWLKTIRPCNITLLTCIVSSWTHHLVDVGMDGRYRSWSNNTRRGYEVFFCDLKIIRFYSHVYAWYCL